MTVDLQTEFQIYCAKLPEMLVNGHDGEYVVIRNTLPLHFERSYEAALNWAYDTFGMERFFVKKVTEDLAMAHFTRDLG